MRTIAARAAQICEKGFMGNLFSEANWMALRE
jgi:hypothetical protein